MEILGSTFDDSFFEESRDKLPVTLSSYTAKICEPEWFCESTATDTHDFLEKQKVLKYRADLAFRRGDHQKALNEYTSCLALVPGGNQTIRRDVLEAMARCFSSLGQREQALDTAELLRKEATNTCHLTCLLHLEVSIHQRCGDIHSKMAALQQLCCLHPFNQWHWAALAEGYISQLESLCAPTPGSRPPPQEETGDTVESEREDQDTIRLKACMCLVRTRLLLKLLRNQQSSFVLQRSERALQRTEELLQRLQPTERTLQLTAEVMGEDLVPEKMREDNQDGESLAGLSLRDFEDRWWSRLLQTGVLQTGVLQTGVLQTGVLQTGVLQTGVLQTGVLHLDAPTSTTVKADITAT